jgi:hypothetical protein
MGGQREVGRNFRTQEEIAAGGSSERLDALLTQLSLEIDRMKDLPHGAHRVADLHHLEAESRRP